MSVPFISEIVERSVDILTDDRYSHAPLLASAALSSAFPDVHWSMLDEHLYCVRQLSAQQPASRRRFRGTLH